MIWCAYGSVPNEFRKPTGFHFEHPFGSKSAQNSYKDQGRNGAPRGGGVRGENGLRFDHPPPQKC